MFQNILNHYITASFYLNLCKVAKLPPEEFKKILRNPYLMYQLDQDGLLDDFMKTMPDMEEQDLESMIDVTKENKTERGKLPPEKQAIVDEFLKEHGDDFLDELLLTFIDKEQYKLIGKDVNLTDSDIRALEDYKNHKLKDFVIDFLEKVDDKSTELLAFISDYKEAVSQTDENIKMYCYEKLAAKIVYMIKFIAAKSDIDENDKYTDAKNLRDSDMFDYILSQEENAASLQNKAKDTYRSKQTLNPPPPSIKPTLPSFAPIDTQTKPLTHNTPTNKDDATLVTKQF